MRKNFIPIALAAAVSLFWTGCKKSDPVVKETTVVPSGPVELKLKWPAGRSLLQSVDAKVNFEMALPGKPEPMRQDIDLKQRYGFTVLKERPEGGREVELELLEAQMNMKQGDKVLLDYDSTERSSGRATNVAASAFGKLVGSRFRYLLDASNHVEKIEGIEEFKARMASDTSGIKNTFSEEYFRNLMSMGRGLPPKPVEPGDKWPVKMEIPMGDLGTMIIDLTYTFEDWRLRNTRYCAAISFDGTITSKPGSSPKDKKMTMSIQNGKSWGETWFDLDMGMFVAMDMNQDMKMLMTMANPRPGSPSTGKSQTLNITNKMNQVIKMKLEAVK